MIKYLMLFLVKPVKKTKYNKIIKYNIKSLSTTKHMMEYALSLEVLQISTMDVVNIMVLYNKPLIVAQ